MKILLTGGGTLGSVNPLIAIYEEAVRQGKRWEWFWVGTRDGVEKPFVESLGISYEWVPGAKLRRYVSPYLAVDPLAFMAAFLRSILIIITVKPDVVVSAGSFVSVPVGWAAKLFGKKIVIHQQDIRPTLSNRLVSPVADRITVSFQKSLQDFPRQKTEWIGNPAREEVSLARPARAREKFKLQAEFPTLLVTGGSSGAEALNQWVWTHLAKLTERTNVVHLTGRGKSDASKTHANYCQLELLEEDFYHALAASDLVVSRAGISTITELGYLGKAAIFIPMPNTHQEDNACYCAREHAALAYRQDELDGRVVRRVRELLASSRERRVLGDGLRKLAKRGAAGRMVSIISELCS